MDNKITDIDEVFQWKAQYSIGVEEIDAAHQKLFSIVRRLLKNILSGDYEKNKKTCIEAVKFLKQYTIEHFAQEEAYQLKIGYGGYETHKRIHTNMRDVTIPALEKQMLETDFPKNPLFILRVFAPLGFLRTLCLKIKLLWAELQAVGILT